MSSDWRQAAKRYQLTKQQKLEAALAATARDAADREQRAQSQQLENEKWLQDRQQAIHSTTSGLRDFMKREGADAIMLLQNSGRHLNFAVYNGGGTVTVFLLSGDGLQIAFERGSMAAFYAKSLPQLRPASVEEIATAAVDHGGFKDGNSLVSWLKKELNKIADEAPQ